MTTWLDKLVKILALGFDTPVEPERLSAFGVATDLAAKHHLSLGSAYLRIERMMPDSFRFLEGKRTAGGLEGFVAEGDMAAGPQAWDANHDHYPGDRRALDAMLSCTVRPLARRGHAR